MPSNRTAAPPGTRGGLRAESQGLCPPLAVGNGNAAPVSEAGLVHDASGSHNRDCRRGTGPKLPSIGAKALKLPRQACFFCAEFAPRTGLPRSHPLAYLQPCREGARALLGCIWGATAPLSPEKVFSSRGCRDAGVLSVRLSPAQQRLMLDIAERLLRRARKLPWRALLDTHCPVPALHGQRPAQQAQQAQHSGVSKRRAGPLDGACSTAAVSCFMCAVLRRLLPPELLGGRRGRSQRALLRHVCKFLALRRFEQMTVHDATHGLRTSGVPWLDVLCALCFARAVLCRGHRLGALAALHVCVNEKLRAVGAWQPSTRRAEVSASETRCCRYD